MNQLRKLGCVLGIQRRRSALQVVAIRLQHHHIPSRSRRLVVVQQSSLTFNRILGVLVTRILTQLDFQVLDRRFDLIRGEGAGADEILAAQTPVVGQPTAAIDDGLGFHLHTRLAFLDHRLDHVGQIVSSRVAVADEQHLQRFGRPVR